MPHYLPRTRQRIKDPIPATTSYVQLHPIRTTKMFLAQKKPFDGLERKLVIAFDVGTTYSGVSYAFLIPGEAPMIQGVTR